MESVDDAQCLIARSTAFKDNIKSVAKQRQGTNTQISSFTESQGLSFTRSPPFALWTQLNLSSKWCGQHPELWHSLKRGFKSHTWNITDFLSSEMQCKYNRKEHIPSDTTYLWVFEGKFEHRKDFRFLMWNRQRSVTLPSSTLFLLAVFSQKNANSTGFA